MTEKWRRRPQTSAEEIQAAREGTASSVSPAPIHLTRIKILGETFALHALERLGAIPDDAWGVEAIMNTEKRKFAHGQDAGKLALALWLFVSPWMLNYSEARLPLWNTFAVAMIVAVFSLAAMLKFTKWEEWINIVAGFWLIASPWLLGYSALLGNTKTLPVTANHLAVGLAIVILSLWELNLWEQAGLTPPKS